MYASILIRGGNLTERNEKAIELASVDSRKEDIVFFDASEKSGIAEVRRLVSKLSKKPYSSPATSTIISEAQNLTIEAQNSLLKTIEEPNITSKLILTSPSEYSLLPTISSRCVKIYLPTKSGEVNSIMESILAAKLYKRLDLVEKLDLADWPGFLRDKLKSSIYRKNLSEDNLLKFVKYLRFVMRIDANKAQANPKLAKYLTVITIPKSLNTLASN